MISNRTTYKTFFLSLLFLLFLQQESLAVSLSSRTWISADYLHWWVQNSPINVPLATENTIPGNFASLNMPGTQIIFGAGSNQNTFNFGGINGLRLTLGGWLDDSQRYGIEGSGFGFLSTQAVYSTSSLGRSFPILDVPFYSIDTGSETVLVGNRPNTITDSNTFQTSSLELNGLYNVGSQNSFPLILSLGFRFMNIHEKLRLNDAIHNTPILPPNAILNVRDQFTTKNNFYGLQLGARTNLTYNNISIEALAEIALGKNIEKLTINGQTNVDDKTIIQPIGLFAEPTNIGTFKNQQFTLIPALQIKMAYKLNKFIRPFITYQVIYINNLILSSNEIDRNINKSQNILIGGSGVLTGPPTPLPQFNNTSLWMQGISIGIELI
jgi:hypothetical protein